MRRLAVLLVPVIMFACSAAYAQSNRKPVTGYIAAGFSTTSGVTEDYLQDGWQISGGAIKHFNPDNPFGIRFDVAYNRWDATRQLLSLGSSENVRINDGFGTMFSVAVDAIWEFGRRGGIGWYVGAGVGGYRRYVALTQQALVSGIICDPWWGVCYPATSVGDVITADDKLTKIGYNAALGLTFPKKSGGEVFLEARFHRMESEEPTEYLPIQIGYRW
jgi:hypothetical protein